MSLSPLRKLLKALAIIIGLMFALVGLVFLLSAAHAYLSSDSGEGLPFVQMLLAVGFLGVPTTALFLYKAQKSFMRGDDGYGLPDAPTYSLLLAFLTISSSIVTVAAFVIFVISF
ncbi:MAG: hypothetical protein C0600_02915 [Ignavibacteria bacterium]|nr:MAG: hypothetical protein C0600_02915 [Ignavibacteria bacterium]